MSESTYPLDEGSARLSWPKDITPKSAKKMKRWLKLMIDDVDDLISELQNNNMEGDGQSGIE